MGKDRRSCLRVIHLVLVSALLLQGCLGIPEELARGSAEQLQEAKSLTAPPGRARLYVFPLVDRVRTLGTTSDDEMYVETTILVTDTAVATVHKGTFVVLDIPPGSYKVTYFSDDPKPIPLSIDLKEGDVDFIRPVYTHPLSLTPAMGIGGLVVDVASAIADDKPFLEWRFVERCAEQCKPLIEEYTLLNTGEVFDFEKQ